MHSPEARLLGAWLRKVQENQQGAARAGCSIREGEPGSKAGRGFISKGTDLQYLKKKSKAGLVAAISSKSPDY